MKIKTIKIIDLFNMLANFEEMPEKIKYWGIDYSWNRFDKDYQKGNGELLFGNMKGIYHLNDEIVIIEEEKEIEKIGKIYDGFTDSYYDTCLETTIKKVDEIIDEINKLKKEIEKENR